MPTDAPTPEQPKYRSRREYRAQARAAMAEGAAGASTPAEPEAPAEMRTSPDEAPASPEASEAQAPAALEGEEAADAFAEAARALKFTGDTSVARVSEGQRGSDSRDVVRRGSHPGRTRRIFTAATASLGAMGVVGVLAIGLTLPLGAVGAPAAVDAPSGPSSGQEGGATAGGGETEEEIQAFVASDEATAQDLDRIGDYDTATFAEIAEADGINPANAFFTNDPTADIQWPYAVGTSMSYGYGMRSGRMHSGVDFTPGDGAPIQAIADGTVRTAREAGGGYGVDVYIDHVVDGQAVTSHYAHMQYGSLRVASGQTVEVGDVIGLTGDTGHSFGAHLHFEMLSGGSTFDPLPWLKKWAGTHFDDQD